jgi:hypothetical protein
MHSSLVRGAKDNVTCILVKYDDVDANQSIQSCNLQDEATIPLFTK